MKLTTMAMSVASTRAVEALIPPDKRLFEDDYSIKFLSPFYRQFINLMKFESFFNYMMNLREKQTPGIVGGLICRTRYIDDALKTAIKEDFEAVVNLGAGFDSRTLRIPGIENLQVYEVDHPDVIDEKIRRMAKSSLRIPSNLTFVPIDFNVQDLSEELSKASYKSTMKTFFIWEGVTQYISQEAIEATLKYVADSAIGSRVVFTYILKDYLNHPDAYPDFQNLNKQLKFAGVKWISGFNPEHLKVNLADYGLLLKEDIGAVDYQQRYLKPINREMSVMEIERIALAEARG